MKILELRALRGPNYHHRQPVIFCKLDLESLEYTPSDCIPNLLENLNEMLPTLAQHKCSLNKVGGFYQHITEGIRAIHIIEHVVLELQNLMGSVVKFAKTYTRQTAGIYDLVFQYENKAIGLKVAEIAVEIVNNLFNGKITSIEPILEELRQIASDTSLEPSAQSIVDAAVKRGIDYQCLNNESYVQLGLGVKQRRFEHTTTDRTSAIAVGIASDNSRVREILMDNKLPVPPGAKISSMQEAIDVVNKIDYPIVLKSCNVNHGNETITNIKDEKDLIDAFNKIYTPGEEYHIEKHLVGNEYYLLLINYQLVTVCLKESACIIENYETTICEISSLENIIHQHLTINNSMLTDGNVDEEIEEVLNDVDLNMYSILSQEECFSVNERTDFWTGDMMIDVTQQIHPSIKIMAEEVAQLMDLDILGIRFIAESISDPIESQISGIIEVNAAPDFNEYLSTDGHMLQNIGDSVVDMLFPKNAEHEIPLIAITGTNGKTTTARMISHIISSTGKIVGMTSTEGVVINHEYVLKGDYSCSLGATRVLRDKRVEYAVLETARGGIMSGGIAFKQCDVGILLNVESDHLGLDGIETLEDLVRAKYTVIEAVKPQGVCVVNADDKYAMSRIDRAVGQRALISLDPENKLLLENLNKGGFNVVLREEDIVIQTTETMISLGLASAFPITFEGKATFNIYNLLASVAATYSLGFDIETIKKGLLSFKPDIDQSAGRMNMIAVKDFNVIIDYGHNPAAIRSTGQFLKSLTKNKLIRLASGVGNRRDIDLIDFGSALAANYDYIILCDPDNRNRPLGATPAMINEGIIRTQLPNKYVEIILDEREACVRALSLAEEGDLVVLQVDDRQAALDAIDQYINRGD